MQVLTKKYNNDPVRAYKGLIRKLNREGFYEELKDREYFKSKGQRKREEIKRSIIRTNKKRRETNLLIAKLDNKKVGSNKQKNK